MDRRARRTVLNGWKQVGGGRVFGTVRYFTVSLSGEQRTKGGPRASIGSTDWIRCIDEEEGARRISVNMTFFAEEVSHTTSIVRKRETEETTWWIRTGHAFVKEIREEQPVRITKRNASTLEERRRSSGFHHHVPSGFVSLYQRCFYLVFPSSTRC